jgi:hypothetical protein
MISRVYGDILSFGAGRSFLVISTFALRKPQSPLRLTLWGRNIIFMMQRLTINSGSAGGHRCAVYDDVLPFGCRKLISGDIQVRASEASESSASDSEGGMR